jgi:hypothetical protein
VTVAAASEDIRTLSAVFSGKIREWRIKPEYSSHNEILFFA